LKKEFKGKGYAEFKKSLAEVLINFLEPFNRKKKELVSREVYIQETLKQGAERAEILAQSTIQEVKKKMAEDLGVDPEDEPELFDKTTQKGACLTRKIIWSH